jgi:hypothetical protein
MDLAPGLRTHAQLVQDCRQVLSGNLPGERLLEHLKQRFHFNSSTAAVNLVGAPALQVDRDTLIFNEGQRSVICYLTGLMETDLAGLHEQARKFAEALESSEPDDTGV